MNKGATYQHRNGGYVVVSDVTDTDVTFAPCGGGFVRSAPHEIFNRDFTQRELPTELYAGLVTLEGCDEPVTGWYNPHHRWNGWLIPFVALEDCLRILDIDSKALTPTDDGFMASLPDQDEAHFSRCSVKGLENFYYIDGFCWEEA